MFPCTSNLSCRRNAIASVTLTLALLAMPALAQDHGHDDHHGQDDHHHYDHPDYHFRAEDRDHLRSHYHDADGWAHRSDRRRYYEGERLEGDWHSRFQPVPQAYYRELPPPPPGYVFGYSNGYAVAYNPTTRIVADVIDLAAAAAGR